MHPNLVKIRTTNPYGFRCGEWAVLRGTIALPHGDSERLCYAVTFDDEVDDFWVVDDPGGMYEFQQL